MNTGGILYSGIYTSLSGIQLEFGMSEFLQGIYIVAFTIGISGGIAKLGLRTAHGLDGISFYISKKEYEDFLNNVVNKNGKWRVTNKNKDIVEIPGNWISTETINISKNETQNQLL